MRHRTRGSSVQVASYTGYTRGCKVSDGAWVNIATWKGGQHTSFHNFETIDDVDPVLKPKSDRTNPVRHLKTSGKIVRLVARFKPYNATYSEFHQGYSSHDVGDGSLLPTLPSAQDIANATDEAYRFFGAGCTKQEVSVPLFVWELGEIKRVVTQLTSLFKGNPSAKHSLPTAEEFGISPVVRDVKDMVSVLRGVQDRLKWMRENDGKPVRVRFSKELPSGEMVSQHVPNYSMITWHRSVTKSYCMFRAHARIRYNVRYLGDAEIKIRTLLQSFGFLNPAKVMWDHLPFSFLLDKFYDIGSALERFSIPFVYNHVVEDMGWSIKVEENTAWYLSYKGQHQKMAEHSKVYYERNPGLKLTLGSPVLRDPSVDGLAYGLRHLSLAKVL